MKSIFIFLIVVVGLFILSSFTFTPDTEIFTYRKTDKAKIELYKRLKVKTISGTDKRFSTDINSPDKCIKYKGYIDKNGSESHSESFNCFDASNYYAEKYIIDCYGNVLEIYQNDKLTVSQEFDSNDNLIEVINYNSDEDETWKFRYEYDDQNNLTLELQCNFNDTTEFNKYTYLDFNGYKILSSKILRSNYNNKEYMEIEEYKYDSLGREVFFMLTNSGEVWEKRITDYTKLTSEDEYFGTSIESKYRKSINIDSIGNPQIAYHYDNNNILTGKTIFTYQNGVLISQIVYNLNGEIKREMLYNNSGQFLCENRYENGILVIQNKCEYYPNSLIKSELRNNFKSSENSIIEYEYEYYN